jgi:ribosomal-protein-alanine N-acetyltransferase
MAALHARTFTTPPPWTATAFRSLLDTPGTFATGDPEGFALGRVVLDEAELLTLAVAPASRRKGIGRDRLAAFETRARDMGATEAHLEVAADNAAAIALYEAAGYARSGLRRAYYDAPDGTRVDALLYRKTLERG